MSAKPRIVFSTFRSSTDPMFLSYARFNRVVGSSARRTVGSPLPQIVLAGGDRGSHEAETSQSADLTARRSRGQATSGPVLCGVWRILATNNRELGRSARAYKTFEAARAHVLALRDEADLLVTTPVTRSGSGMYGWFMSLHTVPVITCGRWYGSVASSIEASMALRAALQDGELDLVAKPVMPERRQTRGGQAAAGDPVW